MKSPQYGPFTRLAALILGVAFLVVAGIALIAGLLIRGLPLWLAVFSVPFASFGWLLFSTGRGGHDPEWFYDALDLSEHEIGEDKNGS